METRANHVFVGAVTLALVALLAAFIIWIAKLNEGSQKEYDIFFKQSVDGLAKGSGVSYSGVPVGQVEKIELWKQDPGFVRVRINVKDDVPVLIGTTATMQSGFTGVSDIQLNGAVRGAPPISERGPEGVPVIPTRPGGFGAILANAPLLLERLSTLTDRLNQFLSDANQKSISGILANSEKISGDLSRASPQLNQTLAELQGTMRQASATLASFQGVANKADVLLGEQGSSLGVQLRETLASAKTAADQLQKTLATAQPALNQVSTTTLPAAEAMIRDLRATSRALRNVTEKIDEQGAAALLKGPKLPDYKP